MTTDRDASQPGMTEREAGRNAPKPLPLEALPINDPTNPAHRLADDLRRGRIPGYAANDLRSLLTSYEAQGERLREVEGALEPFARASDKIHTGYDDGIAAGDHPMWSVFVSDLRKAHSALTAARFIKGVSLNGRQGEPAGMMTVTAHMSDGTDEVLIRDNGNVISHWKNTEALSVLPDGVRAICRSILDDYQTSEAHHPDHVLIRRDHFDALKTALIEAALTQPPAMENGE